MTRLIKNHSSCKLVIAQYLLDTVYNRERISRSDPFLFTVEDIIEWSKEDLYKITVARELRKLRVARLINLEVVDRLGGKYKLLLTENEELKNVRYNRKRFFDMLTQLVIMLELRIKPTLTSYTRELLNDATRVIPETSTESSEITR